MMPRKTIMDQPTASPAARFNEAAAVMPRKTCHCWDERIVVYGFNEAAAVMPRKTSTTFSTMTGA